MKKETKKVDMKVSKVATKASKSVKCKVLFDNTLIGGKMYNKGDEVKLTSTKGCEKFVKII